MNRVLIGWWRTLLSWFRPTPEPAYAGAPWRKASRSNGNGGNNCVEVAFVPEGIAVRDSKDRGGPALLFTAAEWDAFIGSAKDGEFDLPA